MPDISMCKGKHCPFKETCYRYKAMPDQNWQSYFTEIPYDKGKERCEYFTPLRGFSKSIDSDSNRN